MKKCRKCDRYKHVSEFNRCAKNKDGLHSYCRDCHKNHYKINATRHKANVRVSRAKYQETVREHVAKILSSGCVDCGLKDIRVLEFDHVSSDKESEVMQMVRSGYALDRVLAEAKKCEVRCKNCHAIKTYERLGGSWRDKFIAPISVLPSKESLKP